jgi:hypothetical protein
MDAARRYVDFLLSNSAIIVRMDTADNGKQRFAPPRVVLLWFWEGSLLIRRTTSRHHGSSFRFHGVSAKWVFGGSVQSADSRSDGTLRALTSGRIF